MSNPHLKALVAALGRNGWRIIALHPGDDYRISASWEIQRSTKEVSLFIDFDGLEPKGRFCLPIEESYGCEVRGHRAVSLYFRRINKRRERWNDELSEFVDAIERIAATGASDNSQPMTAATEAQLFDGFWRFISYEEDGKRRSPSNLTKMAKYVFIAGEFLPGWSGIWGVFPVNQSGTQTEIRAACRELVLVAETPSDFYFFAAGRFRVDPLQSPKQIDLEQFFGGHEIFPDCDVINRGIYALDGRLRLCLGGTGNPRPTTFSSIGRPELSLGELARDVCDQSPQ